MKIRSDIVRTYQAIHSWTGISTGLLLFICFFAGALTMFQVEIQQWADAGVHPLNVGDAKDVDELDKLLHDTLRQHKDSIDSLTINVHGQGPVLSWQAGRPELGVDAVLHYANMEDGDVHSYQAPSNH